MANEKADQIFQKLAESKVNTNPSKQRQSKVRGHIRKQHRQVIPKEIQETQSMSTEDILNNTSNKKVRPVNRDVHIESGPYIENSSVNQVNSNDLVSQLADAVLEELIERLEKAKS